MGAVHQILTGIKLTNHATGQSSYSRTWTPNDGSTLAAFSPGTTPSGYLDGLSTSADMQRWSTINSGAISQYIGGLEGDDGLPISYAGNYSIEEQNRAWFLQGNFSGERYRGNVGVRYVHTRDSTDGFSYAPGGGYTPVNFLNSYGKWLPSFNIAYDLRDDLDAALRCL